jgi:hypothetical protein
MKNLKKIFAIAMSVATVAMSTSAFAEAITATYDAENTAVLIEDAAAVIGETTGQMTVVVTPDTFGENSTADDIYYINQDDAAAFAAIIENMGVKAALDGEKKWQVRIGGENVDEVIVLDVVFDEEGEVTMKYAYGDVNCDEYQTGEDALEILYYEAWMPSLLDDEDPDRYKAADINMDEFLTGEDALEILYYEAWLPSLLDELLGF